MADIKKNIYLIGNAHIDPVWLWRWQEGYAEVRATYRSALDRMKEFPDFKFTSACSLYLMWIEESDPEMFSEIRQRVEEGRWCITGAWLIQPDCNLPCGESFARHSLIGQQYIKDKFGFYATTGYNVDSFGHNGNIPMILQNSRMKNYVFMRPGPHEKDLPSSLFDWQSADGSVVRCFRIPFAYGITENDFRDLFPKIEAFPRNDHLMAFYGVGNHGGGPTVSMLKAMHEVLPENYIYSTPDEYFEAVKGSEVPCITDDLQFHAKGCYSANSEIKKNTRTSENMLLSAEKYAVLAGHLTGSTYPKEQFETAWKNILFNTFHDIMGGCSIKAAYEDARLYHGEAMAISQRNTNFALQQISKNIDTDTDSLRGDELGAPYVLFNSLPYPVTGTAFIRRGSPSLVTDDTGKAVPMQWVKPDCCTGFSGYLGGAYIFRYELPAYGYKTYSAWKNQPAEEMENPFTCRENYISNGIASFELDPVTGELVSYNVGGEKLCAPSRTVLVDETHCDTWAHGIQEFKNETHHRPTAQLRLTETGPLRAGIRSVQKIGSSTIIRDYSLTAGSDRLEVKTSIDFHEEHKLLKFRFPAAISNGKSYGEIPFGFIERPTDGKEFPCGQWISMNDGKDGIGIASDAKYSFDAEGSTLSLTVTRGCIYADHGGPREGLDEYMDQGVQNFSYLLFPFKSFSNAAKIGSELNCPAEVIQETFHKGALAKSYSGISIDRENVTVTAIKKQEKGSGTVIRLLETEGVDCQLKLRLFDREFTVDMPHFAVKTLVIDGESLRETDFIE